MLLHNLSRRLSLSSDFKIEKRLLEHLLRPRLDAESSTFNGVAAGMTSWSAMKFSALTGL